MKEKSKRTRLYDCAEGSGENRGKREELSKLNLRKASLPRKTGEGG